jgi:PAS domain S-box-containing protein
MFRQKVRNGIRYKFLKDISIILFVGTCVLSAVIAINEDTTLKDSLMTKGLSFASYIAKLSQDPLIMKDYIQLDSIVNEANKDEDILYAVILDAHGVPVTSQYASINYQSPKLKGILSELSKESEFQDIIVTIKKAGLFSEVSVPILTGADTIGAVIVCMSQHNIRRQIIRTILFVIALNLVVAMVLGLVLFIASKKTVLDPIVALGHAADRLAKGDLSTHVNIKTTGEIRMLVDSFNQMAEDLERTTVSKEYVDNIINNMNDALIVVSPEGKILNINGATHRLLGYEEGEIVGRPVRMIFGEVLSMPEGGRDLSAMSVVTNGERVYLTKDGRKIPVSLSVSAMNDAEGHFLGLICMAQDITERKRAEEERKTLEERLQRAEKMEALGTLAGGIAHDLNNVLGIIVGYSELLLFKIDAASPARAYVMNIMQGGERAAAIVQDMLTLARRGVPVEQVVNLNSIITDYQKTPEFLKVISFHPQVVVQTDLEPELLNIKGSPIHLGKTLMNLVSNAAEAMANGGMLTIATGNQYMDRPVYGYDDIKEGDYVVLTVSDTGEGIPAADLKRIFEPFYTKKVMGRSGTGLGLTVVWGTVKDHNGYIDVQSEEGRGTIFTLYFPVTREEMPGDQVSMSMAEYMGNGESILVVDDVAGQRDLMARMLEKLNYQVTAVSSGEEAVAYVKSQKVDLVVLDMIMDPGMDGLDTYRKIIEIHPKQKAIIVSGFSETDRVKQAKALGAGAYVKKPYVLEKLGLAVRKELNRQ